MKKYLGLSVGIGACTMASHCMAYGVLGSGISERGARLWLGVLAVILFFTGAGMIVSVLYLFSSGQAFRKSMGKLIRLFGGYLAVQFAMGVIAGAFAWSMGELFGMRAETVKSSTDMFCRVLQIPVRAGALLMFIEIMAGIRARGQMICIKTAVSCAVYTACQCLAVLMGMGGGSLAARGIVSVLLTGGFWFYVYKECMKEDSTR